MCDLLRMLCEHSAKQSGGSYVKKRYIDLVDELFEKKLSKQEQEKLADKIIAETIAKFGLSSKNQRKKEA